MPTCVELQARVRCPGSSFSESGKRVSARSDGDQVVFFRTDDIEVKKFFKATDDPWSDLLVVRSGGETLALYVELKGAHFEKAVEQLRSTINRTRECVRGTFGVTRWRAVVLLGGGGAPHKDDRARREFHRATSIELRVISGAKRCDLREQGLLD
jgi:hypothetical protein